MDIRELTADELPLIAELDTSATEHAYDLISPDVGSGLVLCKRADEPPVERATWGANEITGRMELWCRNFADGWKFWGAFAGDRLIGFLLLSNEESDGAHEIVSIFVVRKSRGKGVGARLVATAEEYCARSGVDRISVSTTLRDSTVEFYQKAGFRLVGLSSRCPRYPRGWVTFIKDISRPDNRVQATR